MLKDKTPSLKPVNNKTCKKMGTVHQLTDSDLVQLAIAQQGASLRTKFPNIEFLNNSITIVNNQREGVVGIYVSDENVVGIPDEITIKFPNGKNYRIGTEIITGVGLATITSGIDGAVSNANLFGLEGSGCCILHNEENVNYLLTNCHVLTDGFKKNPLFNTGNDKVLYNGDELGEWFYGSMTTAGDFALVTIDNIDSFTNSGEFEIFEPVPREITEDDWLKLKVNVRGKVSQTTEAYIIEVVSQQVKIKYKEGMSIIFDTVILVGNRPNKNCKPVTVEGDSGGAVFDDQMQLIGIITAVGNKYSYIIPINDFINSHQLKINRS
jgi:hypothetical protein